MHLLRFGSGHERGAVALISVLVIGAVGTAIAMSLALMGIDAARMSALGESIAKARRNANTCAESALNALRLDDAYTGNTSYAVLEGTCEVLPVTGSGGARRVQARGTVNNVIRKVEVQTTEINPLVVVQSWYEVAEFSP